MKLQQFKSKHNNVTVKATGPIHTVDPMTVEQASTQALTQAQATTVISSLEHPRSCLCVMVSTDPEILPY